MENRKMLDVLKNFKKFQRRPNPAEKMKMKTKFSKSIFVPYPREQVKETEPENAVEELRRLVELTANRRESRDVGEVEEEGQDEKEDERSKNLGHENAIEKLRRLVELTAKKRKSRDVREVEEEKEDERSRSLGLGTTTGHFRVRKLSPKTTLVSYKGGYYTDMAGSEEDILDDKAVKLLYKFPHAIHNSTLLDYALMTNSIKTQSVSNKIDFEDATLYTIVK